MGWERARVTDRSDDPVIQFEAGRWSTPLCRALRDHCRRRLILDPQAGRIPPELSAVLKHEPERRSGAAQPALLVRLEGKTVRGRVEHQPRGESVEFRSTPLLVPRPVDWWVRDPRTQLSFQGWICAVQSFREIWTTSRSDLVVHVYCV